MRPRELRSFVWFCPRFSTLINPNRSIHVRVWTISKALGRIPTKYIDAVQQTIGLCLKVIFYLGKDPATKSDEFLETKPSYPWLLELHICAYFGGSFALIESLTWQFSWWFFSAGWPMLTQVDTPLHIPNPSPYLLCASHKFTCVPACVCSAPCVHTEPVVKNLNCSRSS